MIKGKILDINADGSAIIQAPIDPYILTHRKVKECYVDFIDSRPLSDKQRRMCYALTNAIADWAGYTREMMHLDRKFEFTKERAEEFPELTEKLFLALNCINDSYSSVSEIPNRIYFRQRYPAEISTVGLCGRYRKLYVHVPYP